VREREREKERKRVRKKERQREREKDGINGALSNDHNKTGAHKYKIYKKGSLHIRIKSLAPIINSSESLSSRF